MPKSGTKKIAKWCAGPSVSGKVRTAVKRRIEKRTRRNNLKRIQWERY